MRTVVLSLAAVTTPALADGIAFWLSHVTTDDGDAIVEHGETAMMTLSVLMDPDLIEHNAIIAASVFDTLGDEHAYHGHVVSWFIHNNLAELTGDLTTTDGASLFGTHAGQICAINTYWTYDNPVDIITIEWAPLDAGTYDVTYSTSSDRGIVHVYEYTDDAHDADVVQYPVLETAIEFSVANCIADFNGDGAFDILDFVAFQLAWQKGDSAADCDKDGAFTVLDFVCFQQSFQKGCL